MEAIPLITPFDTDTVRRLRAGDRVTMSGVVYTARDAAHKRMIEAIEAGRLLPLTLSVLAKNSPIHDQKVDKMGILIF